MTIKFREMVKQDETFLANVLHHSFNEDSERALGREHRCGPPGYDDGTLAKKILSDNHQIKRVIQMDKEDIGVLVFKEGESNTIEYFCLLPTYAGQGIGSLVWQQFEQEKTGVWHLETPGFSERNHHFYQKNGFVKTGERLYGEAKSFVFEKKLPL